MKYSSSKYSKMNAEIIKIKGKQDTNFTTTFLHLLKDFKILQY